MLEGYIYEKGQGKHGEKRGGKEGTWIKERKKHDGTRSDHGKEEVRDGKKQDKEEAREDKHQRGQEAREDKKQEKARSTVRGRLLQPVLPSQKKNPKTPQKQTPPKNEPTYNRPQRPDQNLTQLDRIVKICHTRRFIGGLCKVG